MRILFSLQGFLRAFAPRAAMRKSGHRPSRSLFHNFALLLAALVLTACATTGPRGPSPLEEMLLAREAAGASEETAQLLAFYRARDFRPAWIVGADAVARAELAEEVLSRAHEQGLHPRDYTVTPGDGLDYDIVLSAAVLRYARDITGGRVRPASVYKDVGLPASDFDAPVSLDRALSGGSLAGFFADLPPPHPEYRRLVEALAHYRALANEGGWDTLPEVRVDGPVAGRNALAQRLALEDPEIARINGPSVAQLREAVRRFQRRNGLDADGVVGPNTLAALNIPASARVAQIAANMERWRWLPRRFENRHIVVDVPDQSVAFVQDGDVALTSRAIVGRMTTTTPILKTNIRGIVANPPWNIPGDISARDLLPQLRRNPNYLKTRNMILVDGPADDPHGTKIDWRRESPARMASRRIQELPGPTSGLGLLMLDMPNDFDVYLHDTPNKELFDLDERTISNGCIRVQEIFALVSLAMTGDKEEAVPRLRQINRTRETQRIALDTPLPVYLVYWTASAAPDGTVSFRPDFYERDNPLIAALGGADHQLRGADLALLGDARP
jgi:murein L,D-transpeptidase YcbB/YkuD